MAMELVNRAAVGVPFAHGHDDGGQVQVPLFGIYPEWDEDGNPLPLYFNSRPRTMTYDGSNRIQTEVVTGVGDTAGVTWTKTYTYTGSNLTGISGWVRTE